MRIAGRRPLITTVPIGAIVVTLGSLLALIAVIAAVAAFGGSSGAASISTRHLSMADAYGIGGLGNLRASHDAAPGAPSPIERNLIVTYYGNPYTPSMGVLGEYRPEQAADLLSTRAARFAFAGSDRNVLPALHVVYAVAQPEPGADAGNLQYLDDRSVRMYIDMARRRGFITILDLQIGHNAPLAEVQRILPYLREPDVFVALDPEFALPADKKPGEAIGSIDASDINAVQWYLGKLSEQYGLPKKMLIVHQFQADMITNAAAIEHHSDVDLVVDMDGYGPADIKEVKYRTYGAAPYAAYGGIKVFLDHDTPPLTEEQLLAMQPQPSLFVYQ